MSIGKLTIIGAFAAIASVGGLTSQASANLISDGTFNSPYGGSSFVDYSAGPMGPWTVTGTVDLIGGYWQAPLNPIGTPGVGSVDLDGVSVGGISQTIATTPGQTYLLSFYLSGNPDGTGTTQENTPDTKFLVVLGSTDYTFLTNVGGQSHSDMDYVLETLLFTASGTSTDISFDSDDAPPSYYGPVIGDVSVTATPLPPAAALFAGGLGLIGFIARRKRKNRPSLSSARLGIQAC